MKGRDSEEKINVEEIQWTSLQLYMRMAVDGSKYSSVSQNDRCHYIHQAECYPGNRNLPFSSDFGDLEAKVHRVEIRGLPLEDLITPPGLVSLQENPIPKEITDREDLLGINTY